MTNKWTRVLLGVGFIAAAAVACDDSGSGGSGDDGTGGTATGGSTNNTGGSTNNTGGSTNNTGGTLNNTGGTGSGGVATGGLGGLGGLGGMGGDATASGGTASGGTASGGTASGGSGTGGDPGVSIECADGCAVLTSPMTAKEQSARFQIYLDANVSTETLTFRIYVKSGLEGGFQYGFQNGADLNYAGIYPWKNLAPAGGGWQELTIDMKDYAPADTGAGGEGGAPPATGPDSSKVKILNLWLESGGGSGPWANPSVVYVDSVKSSNGTINYEFQSGVSDLHAGGSNVAGSGVTHTTIDP